MSIVNLDFSIVIGFTLGYPMALAFGLNYCAGDHLKPKSPIEVICIFGYSTVYYIPATVLAMIPYKVNFSSNS